MSQELLETFLPKTFDHQITKFSPSDVPNGFYAELRVNIKTEEDVKKWKSGFEKLSGTNYIVGQNYNVQRTQFKKVFVCRRSNKNKLDIENDGRRTSIKLNSDCKTKISIKIKLDTPKTRRSDHFVKEGLLGEVQITWLHSHAVGAESIDSLLKLNITEETQAAFITYFEMGYNPPQAKLYHQEVLELKSDFNPAITLADSSVNPKDRVIEYIYDKWRRATHGDRNGPNMIRKLSERIEELQGEGMKIAMTEFPFVVAMVTPIASRVHMHEMSKHIVFVDSTASCDLDGHTVTFLLTASPAGALPLGALITNSQGQEAYANGFKLLRKLLGNGSFGGKGYPSVFMTDDSNAERGGLKEAWPESNQLLCQFHGPQAMWTWLWLGTHGIENKDRAPLMQLYRDIMYAMDDESAQAAYEKAILTAMFDVPRLIPTIDGKICRAMAVIAVGDCAPSVQFYDVENTQSTNENIEPMDDSAVMPAQVETEPTPWFDEEEVVNDRAVLVSKFTEAINSLPLDDPNAHN